MYEWISTWIQWAFTAGDPYGVNTVLFGIIYLGTVPPYWFGLAWMGRNLKKGVSAYAPAFTVGLSSIAPYLYIVLAGNGIPVHFWAVLIITGTIFTIPFLIKIARRCCCSSKNIHSRAEIIPSAAMEHPVLPENFQYK